MESEPERNDGQLLAAWLGGEEAAFTELVGRHGPMVLGVCRRVLGAGAGADAEDAGQAAFVALARKARGLSSQPGVGAWLHRAAWFAATKAVRSVRRREDHERGAARLRPAVAEESIAAATAEWEQVRPHLDAALEQLPEKYRRVLTACYLQGRSQAEVARDLGLPEGTVASRCKRGLERLRRRLAARGVRAGSAALGPMVLAGCATEGALPPGFAAGALLVIKGAGVGKAVAIAEAVMKTLFWIKAKKVVAVCTGALVLGAVGPSALIAARSASAGTPAKPDPKVARLEREVAELKKKLADLEEQVKTLRLLVNKGARSLSPREAFLAKKRKVAKIHERISQLCAALRQKGKAAKDSPEMRELVKLGGHELAEVRLYLAKSLIRLPRGIVGAELAGMVKSGSYDLAALVLGGFRGWKDAGAKGAAASRAEALVLVHGTPDYGEREEFLRQACLYLCELGDPRGVRIYMRVLKDQAAEVARQRDRGAVALTPALMRNTNLNRISRYSGYGKQFPKKWVHDKTYRPLVADFLAWWEKNKAGFKKIRAGELKNPGGGKKLEQF
jgi:RNA polymerase sigma factor (sigma-70 family)